MTTPEIHDMPAVPMHLASSSIDLGQLGRRRQRERAFTPRTIMLTTGNPIRPALNRDTSRKVAFVQALGNPVVLCKNKADASITDGAVLNPSAPGATIANTGSLSNPQAGGQVAAVTLPWAGAYQVEVLGQYAGTVTATDLDNMGLYLNGVQIAKLLTNIVSASSAQNQVLPFSVSSTAPSEVLAVDAIANGSGASATYRAIILASPQPGADAWVELDITDELWITALAFPAWLSMVVVNYAD